MQPGEIENQVNQGAQRRFNLENRIFNWFGGLSGRNGRYWNEDSHHDRFIIKQRVTRNLRDKFLFRNLVTSRRHLEATTRRKSRLWSLDPENDRFVIEALHQETARVVNRNLELAAGVSRAPVAASVPVPVPASCRKRGYQRGRWEITSWNNSLGKTIQLPLRRTGGGGGGGRREKNADVIGNILRKHQSISVAGA
ncbi:uncharacterized protein LOC117176556 [Belonocnema kinseyi]|uniref:uncharacterized protein LOC117176556 n=1 Tax=Belonocnema kinseyi TaxID=2817044 RepID=UPI00143E0787|nr:uncharacterized protein LOC117176556 [Belonocnema kinseyi]